MGKPESTPPQGLVLAVARDARQQQAIAAGLVPEYAVRPVLPSELAERGPLVDAHAAIVVLAPGQDPEELAPIRDLPAGRALILLTDVEDGDVLEAAVERLRPQAVLPAGPPAVALRLALRSGLPSAGDAGEGARHNHRRAPALLGVSKAIRELMEEGAAARGFEHPGADPGRDGNRQGTRGPRHP